MISRDQLPHPKESESHQVALIAAVLAVAWLLALAVWMAWNVNGY